MRKEKKICIKCNEEKDISAFAKINYKSSHIRSDGRRSTCMKCMNSQYNRKYFDKYQKNISINNCDTYIRQLLTAQFKISVKQITPEMMELKRKSNEIRKKLKSDNLKFN